MSVSVSERERERERERRFGHRSQKAAKPSRVQKKKVRS